MHQNDFDRFVKLLRQLAATYGKKLTDDLTQGYWTALKDQPLERITMLAEFRMKHSKFFPKPAELRPAEERAAPSADGKFEQCEERALENLEELRKVHPQAWVASVRKSHGSSCLALTYADTFGAENIWFDIPSRSWRHL